MTSLRLRAVLGALLATAAALSVGGWIIWSLFAASAERQFDAQLVVPRSALAFGGHLVAVALKRWDEAQSGFGRPYRDAA